MNCLARQIRTAAWKPSPSLKEVGMMILTVLACVTVLGTAMDGGDLVRKVAVRLFGESLSEPLPGPVSVPSGAELELSKLVGRWLRVSDGTRILVSKGGEVWSDSGKLQGKLRRTTQADANFAFGDEHYFCSYDISFLGGDLATWRLVDHSTTTVCPSGTFERPFAY